MRDLLGYAGKTVVVSGAASGMGAAVAETLVDLGAAVHALDLKPIAAKVAQAVEVDLRSRASIEAAIATLPQRVDRVFNCAGLPGAPFSALDTMLVNFAGLRQLTEGLLPRMPEGGSVSSITSVAGMGFRKNLENVKALCATRDFDEAKAWCEAHPKQANGYLFSKQCIIWYTMERAVSLVPRRIRMNCLSPAPTDTPMLPAFHAQVNREFIEQHFQAPVGRNATPEEMAEPLVLLGSDAARFVSGVNLFVDYGYLAAVETGAKAGLL